MSYYAKFLKWDKDPQKHADAKLVFSSGNRPDFYIINATSDAKAALIADRECTKQGFIAFQLFKGVPPHDGAITPIMRVDTQSQEFLRDYQAIEELLP